MDAEGVNKSFRVLLLNATDPRINRSIASERLP